MAYRPVRVYPKSTPIIEKKPIRPTMFPLPEADLALDWQMDPRYQPSLDNPIDEIEPWLCVGSHQARDHVSMWGIDHVMSLSLLSERAKYSDLPKDVVEVHFKLGDNQSHDPVIMREFLKSTWNLLSQWQEKGYHVLVHCDAGVSRSAFVLCDFLMKRDGLCFLHALERLEKKRYCLCPNPLFQRILKGEV